MAAMSAYFAQARPAFWNARNIITMFQEASLWGIAAIGVTFVMIAGGMDLSIGAIIGFSTMLAVNFMHTIKLPAPVYIPVILLAGALIGYLNALIITRLDLMDFIATLATKGLVSGLALVIAIKEGGFVANVFINDPGYLALNHKFFREIHLVIPVFFLAALIAHVILARTPTGTYVYAVGSNVNSSVFSGISVRRVKTVVYMLSGLCSAMSALFISARMRTAMPDMGLGLELDVVAAVIIGGTAFKGGSGDISGTVIGVLFLALLKNGIFKFHVSPAWQPVIIGGVITVTVIFDETYKRIAARIQERRLDAEASARSGASEP